MKETNNILEIAPLLTWQLLIFLGFVCSTYLLPSFFRPSIESQIEQWDSNTIQTLHSSLDMLTEGSELSKKKEAEVLQQLRILMETLGWQIEKMQFYTRISDELYSPIDLRLEVQGHSAELFFLLEGVSRLDTFARLEELSVEAKERDLLKLRFRFFRPNFPSASWIEEQKHLSEKERAILKQGWALWCWKSYRRQEDVWRAETRKRRESFWLQLSAQLSAYRFTRKDIHWDLKRGFRDRIQRGSQ